MMLLSSGQKMTSNEQCLVSRFSQFLRLTAMNFRSCPRGAGLSGLILLVTLLAWVVPGFAETNTASKLASADCLDCHTDPANKRMVNGHAEAMALFPTNGFAKSVHSALDCIDCHDGIKEMQHDKNVPPPNCTGCHEKEGKDYADQHPRHEPQHGRVRRGAMLGLPRQPRNRAGETHRLRRCIK